MPTRSLFPNTAPRLPVIALIVIVVLYLFAGVVGRDPWKTEDAVHIGIAYGFMTEGNWLLPRVAGEAWPHTAPLYHWVAAVMGRLFAGGLPFHDAARLASPLFGMLFLLGLSGAARAFVGNAAAYTAPLLAIGTLGLLIPLHEAQPATAGLAFAATAWWGGGLIRQGRRYGALLLGAGVGLAFAAHGLAGLLMAATALLAPIFHRNGRSLIIAVLIAAPLAATWPLMLFNFSPGDWQQWWQNELAEATVARGLPSRRHLEQLAWAAWPVLPLALWGLWLRYREPTSSILPILGSLLGLTWYLSGSSRTLSLLPAIIPLTLLATASVEKLRRGAANAFDWFGVMTFSSITVLLWVGASAQSLGWPPTIARNFAKLAPGYPASHAWMPLVLAFLLTLAWIALWRLPRAPWRAPLHWAAGTTLMWVLVTTLWLPWINHYKSYVPVIASLRDSLPQDADCIQRSGLDAAELALLDYHGRIRTISPGARRNCTWRLTDAAQNRAPPAGWTERWQGHRSSQRDDSWFLDQRD